MRPKDFPAGEIPSPQPHASLPNHSPVLPCVRLSPSLSGGAAMSRVLLGYDIRNAGRRRWALRQLRALTGRYQESFFDCVLDEGQARAVWKRLTAGLDPLEDGLILARVDEQQ